MQLKPRMVLAMPALRVMQKETHIRFSRSVALICAFALSGILAGTALAWSGDIAFADESVVSESQTISASISALTSMIVTDESSSSSAAVQSSGADDISTSADASTSSSQAEGDASLTEEQVAEIYPGLSFGSASSERTQQILQTQQALTTQSSISVNWTRIWGNSALDTMQKISQAGWQRCHTVVVTTMDGYWDALSASAVAGLYHCPILLTNSQTLSSQTESELSRLGCSQVLIIGGDTAVSSDVERSINNMGVSTERLWGDTATLTAVDVANSRKGSWGDTCVVATSDSYYDALSVASYAYYSYAPVFLTESGTHTLSDETVKAIEDGGFSKVVVVGGSAAVYDSVIDDQLSSLDCTRLWGNNAYETSIEIAEFCTEHGMTCEDIGVASGDSYYDALAGAALCGKNGSVLVLVSDSNHEAIRDYIVPNDGSIETGYVFGGSTAVSDDTYSSLSDYIDIGQLAARYCLDAVGSTYSQEKRWAEGYYDCSSLAYRAYSETSDSSGFDFSDCYSSDLTTAAAEAQWIVSTGRTVSVDDLRPGDWIFYGGADNGRYLGIYHVAIYLGDGKQVAAIGDDEGIAEQNFSASNISLYGRPYGTL